jgi:hypothetical protein
MRRLVVLATAGALVALCVGGCSSRALRAPDDLWEGASSPDSAAFLGYNGRVERPGPALD